MEKAVFRQTFFLLLLATLVVAESSPTPSPSLETRTQPIERETVVFEPIQTNAVPGSGDVPATGFFSFTTSTMLYLLVAFAILVIVTGYALAPARDKIR